MMKTKQLQNYRPNYESLMTDNTRAFVKESNAQVAVAASKGFGGIFSHLIAAGLGVGATLAAPGTLSFVMDKRNPPDDSSSDKGSIKTNDLLGLAGLGIGGYILYDYLNGKERKSNARSSAIRDVENLINKRKRMIKSKKKQIDLMDQDNPVYIE